MKQYNYKDLERIYIDRISPKCKQQLGEKILEPYPQAMIRKVLAFQDDTTTKARYPFTNAEYDELNARGGWNYTKNRKLITYEYPGLFYLVDTYMNPLSILRACMKKVERLAKETNNPDLIKAMLP